MVWRAAVVSKCLRESKNKRLKNTQTYLKSSVIEGRLEQSTINPKHLIQKWPIDQTTRK